MSAVGLVELRVLVVRGESAGGWEGRWRLNLSVGKPGPRFGWGAPQASSLPQAEIPKGSRCYTHSSSKGFVCMHVQLCPTLCYLMDCSPPGSSGHGISQARILAWVAISYSRGSCRPGIEPASAVSPVLAVRFFTTVLPGKASKGFGPSLLCRAQCLPGLGARRGPCAALGS